MSQINLNSYYTSSKNVETPKRIVVNGPQSLPNVHVFNDIDANQKFDIVNAELHAKSKKEKNKTARKFLKVFCGIVLAIIAALGIRKIFK